MEATAKTERHGKEQSGSDEFACMRGEIPVLSPAI
jgi:hypothetical protein